MEQFLLRTEKIRKSACMITWVNHLPAPSTSCRLASSCLQDSTASSHITRFQLPQRCWANTKSVELQSPTTWGFPADTGRVCAENDWYERKKPTSGNRLKNHQERRIPFIWQIQFLCAFGLTNPGLDIVFFSSVLANQTNVYPMHNEICFCYL